VKTKKEENTMSEFIINDYLLRQEAERIVTDILTETHGFEEIQDAICWSCDSHEWVIYYHKALKLCAECNTNEGEAMLECTGQTFNNIGEHAASVAYWTLVCACQDAFQQS
jgi:hypothetical protein